MKKLGKTSKEAEKRGQDLTGLVWAGKNEKKTMKQRKKLKKRMLKDKKKIAKRKNNRWLVEKERVKKRKRK